MWAEKISEDRVKHSNKLENQHWNKINEIKAKERDLYRDWRSYNFKNDRKKMIKCGFKWEFEIRYKLKKIEIKQQQGLF